MEEWTTGGNYHNIWYIGRLEFELIQVGIVVFRRQANSFQLLSRPIDEK